jgi:hypothetical protein
MRIEQSLAETLEGLRAKAAAVIALADAAGYLHQSGTTTWISPCLSFATLPDPPRAR